ncbi:MAG: hypothetical protein ACRD1G_04220, partial [Acidimicrobiales bacterium]
MGAVAIAGGTLVGVVTATSGVAFAAPPACTFNGSPTFVPGVLPGSVITLACTNLPAADSFAIAESSGLARVISPASDAQSVRDVAASKLGVTAATLQAGTTYTLPATYTATDPNAQCPMPQAQANLGVTNCTLEVDDVTTGNVPVGNALLGYTADATPANPTLTAAPGVGKAGDSVTVNGTGFWGAAISGAPGVLLGNPISAPAVTVGPNAVTPVSGNAVVPTVYNSNGTTGTFAANSATYGPAVLHVPAAVAGSNPVNVLEANTTPLTGNGSGGTVAGSAPFTVLGTPTLLA